VGFPSIRDAVRDRWENAEVSLWLPKRPPLILCESRSLMGVLENLAGEFHCPITSTNGQCAGFLHVTLGPALRPGDLILLFGDWDKGGADIESNDRKVLDEIVPGLIWERVAITEEQIEKHKLERIPRKDGRDKKTRLVVETEALGQERIIGLLRARLEELLPEKQRERVRRRQERERKRLGREYGFGK